MIAFLSPLYLMAAVAAAIPLLIHLLRRRIGVRLEFPAVRYLERAEKEHSRRLRLRNLLLMLLRVAAVLLVALAAARPVTRVAGGGHAPTALAIVLDNSLSSSAVSGGHAVLDELKARARAVARRASSDDRLWLVTADGVVRGGARGGVLEAIDRAEPLAGAGNPGRAVERAASLVHGAALPEREIAVITDGQATTWPRAISVSAARLFLYRSGRPPPLNHAVVEAQGAPLRWTPRGAIRARVLTPDSATYRLTLQGRTLARGTVVASEEIMVRAAPSERGWTAGTVELEPDELRGDDVRHFALWIGPAPAVGPHPALGLFAKSAVDALVQAGRVTIGSEIAIVPADELTSLPALIVAPSSPVRVGVANRALQRLAVPWQLGALRSGATTVQGERLAGVSVAQRYALHPRGADAVDTLARVAGEPWIVAGPRYLLIGSSLTPDATDLPVRAAFVPWLDDVISQRLSAAGGRVVSAAPGDPVPRPRSVDALEPPVGPALPLVGDTIAAPERPGVYFFLRGGARVGALVVNPEPRESVLDRLDLVALRDRFPGARATVTSDSSAWGSAGFASPPRRTIVAPLVVLLLATLLLESEVAGAGRRRTA
ncbi:MAG: BatA domain-containing protein [Gemmatimonadota bacterium]|nr:BatA domain-containing protein [Gemmatimonadota bacterium]